MGKSHTQLSKSMCWKYQPRLQQSPTAPKATHYPADDPMEWTNHLVQAPHLLTLESEEGGWKSLGSSPRHTRRTFIPQTLLSGVAEREDDIWPVLSRPPLLPREPELGNPGHPASKSSRAKAPPQAYKGHRAAPGSWAHLPGGAESQRLGRLQPLGQPNSIQLSRRLLAPALPPPRTLLSAQREEDGDALCRSSHGAALPG